MAGLLEQQEMVYVIYVGLALGVFLVLTGMTQLLSRGENRAETKSRRMQMIAKGATTEEILALLKPVHKGGVLTRLPFIGDLPKLILQSGLTIRPAKFLFLCTLVTVGLAFVGASLYGPLRAIPAAFGIGFILPILVLRSKHSARTTLLTKQLPDALDLLARGLRVGHPLNTSIGAVANEMADPIGSEFGIIFDQVSYGEDLVDAFHEFSQRVDLEDVHYLSASIGIQHGTGGDLARVIQVLSKVIRDRIAMRRKISAISSEGRMSAYFLSALPLIIFGFTSVTSPDYYGGVAEDPLYLPMAIAVVGFTVTNYLVLKHLVNFRI